MIALTLLSPLSINFVEPFSALKLDTLFSTNAVEPVYTLKL